jgi:hypothetical protein
MLDVPCASEYLRHRGRPTHGRLIVILSLSKGGARGERCNS